MTLIEPQTESKIAPDLYGAAWLNGDPYELRRGDGDVVLIDFWSTTCVGCLEDLRNVALWKEMYADAGLMVVGVHSPEYEFAFDPAHVGMIAGKYGVGHRIVLDNGGSIRSSYGVLSLPTKALVDRQGIIRYILSGRKDIVDFERAIQYLLREAGHHGELPSLIDTAAELTRLTDTSSIDVRCGYVGGTIGNPDGMAPESRSIYTDPGTDIPLRMFLDGLWWSARDALRSEPEPSSSSSVRMVIAGGDLYLVAGSSDETPVDLDILLNGEPPTKINLGHDVQKTKDGTAQLRVTKPQTYHLLAGLLERPNEVKLICRSGVDIYQFSISGSGDMRSIFPN